MLKHEALSLAQADPIDDRGVVESVGDDRAVLIQKGLEDPAIGVEAGSVENRVISLQELRDLLFQLFVDVLRAADEPNRAHPIAPLVQGPMGSLDDLGMRGQTQVVIGAEVDHLVATLDSDIRRLGAHDDPLLFVEPFIANLLNFPLQILLNLTVHGCLRY